MNRYPTWKYVIIGVTLLVALVYTLPNFYGEAPAVQVSPLRATLKADEALLARAGRAREEQHRHDRHASRCDRRQGAPARRRRADPDQGPAAGPARRGLRGRAQPALQHPGLARGDRREADVPGPRSPRRRAL